VQLPYDTTLSVPLPCQLYLKALITLWLIRVNGIFLKAVPEVYKPIWLAVAALLSQAVKLVKEYPDMLLGMVSGFCSPEDNDVIETPFHLQATQLQAVKPPMAMAATTVANHNILTLKLSKERLQLFGSLTPPLC
jgi:hypothetical protein